MPRRRIRSKQHARRRKDARRRRWGLYAIGALLLTGLLIGLTHWSVWEIESVTAETEGYINPTHVSELTNSILKEPWLGIVSQNNILLLPRQNIKDRLQEISTRIEEVEVDVTGLHSLTVRLHNHRPVAEVCRYTSPQDCWLINKKGFIFGRFEPSHSERATSTTTTSVRYFIDSDISTGSQLLPVHRFRVLHSFISALPDIGMKPTAAEIREYGDVFIPINKLDETATSTSLVELKINYYDDLEQVASNLQTVIDNQSFVTSSPTTDEEVSISPFELEYIDLRFENKVFYK